MFKITECKEQCSCDVCQDKSCEWAGKRGDFAVVNESAAEFYSDNEYLQTPIPVNVTSAT